MTRLDTHSASLIHHHIRYEPAISKCTYGCCYYEAIFACSSKHSCLITPGHRQKGSPGSSQGLRSESVTAFGNTHATGQLPVVMIWYRRYSPLKQDIVNASTHMAALHNRFNLPSRSRFMRHATHWLVAAWFTSLLFTLPRLTVLSVTINLKYDELTVAEWRVSVSKLPDPIWAHQVITAFT